MFLVRNALAYFVRVNYGEKSFIKLVSTRPKLNPGRRDTHRNDIWVNDTEHTDTAQRRSKEPHRKYNESYRNDIQHNGAQLNDTQHNGAQHKVTQHNDSQHIDTQHNEAQY